MTLKTKLSGSHQLVVGTNLAPEFFQRLGITDLNGVNIHAAYNGAASKYVIKGPQGESEIALVSANDKSIKNGLIAAGAKFG